jgi:hypothetical protein
LSSFSFDQEAVGAAAQDLTEIGSTIKSATDAAAASTTQVAAAAQDEVSAAVAGVFGSYGQRFQALTALAERFHDQFTQGVTAGAAAYARAEAANTAPLGGRIEQIEARITALVTEARSVGIAEVIKRVRRL